MYFKSNIHEELLLSKGFKACSNHSKYNSLGKLYVLNEAIGNGYFWIYTHENLFSIVIHDFYVHEDFCIKSDLAEYFSISYFESVSGEELNPYRKISAGCIKGFWSKAYPYQAVFHKKIPIKTIGIEFMPAFCDDFLKNKYPDDYINPRTALLSIDETRTFPEMIELLKQVEHYSGNGISAKLFYESKANEAMSMVYDYHLSNEKRKKIQLSSEDIRQLQNVASYINDHYAYEMPLSKLCNIACMGSTKLKQTFKAYHACTITEYIQQRRMSQAEHLLKQTELNSSQIALVVGYKSASRFSHLFKKSTGLSPTDYRRCANNKKI